MESKKVTQTHPIVIEELVSVIGWN